MVRHRDITKLPDQFCSIMTTERNHYPFTSLTPVDLSSPFWPSASRISNTSSIPLILYCILHFPLLSSHFLCVAVFLQHFIHCYICDIRPSDIFHTTFSLSHTYFSFRFVFFRIHSVHWYCCGFIRSSSCWQIGELLLHPNTVTYKRVPSCEALWSYGSWHTLKEWVVFQFTNNGF